MFAHSEISQPNCCVNSATFGPFDGDRYRNAFPVEILDNAPIEGQHEGAGSYPGSGKVSTSAKSGGRYLAKPASPAIGCESAGYRMADSVLISHLHELSLIASDP